VQNNIIIQGNKARRGIVSTVTIFLCFITIHSFLVHLYSYTFSVSAYCIVLVVLTMFYAISQTIIAIRNDWLSFAWILAIVVAVISLLLSRRTPNAVLDVICLFCCMVIALFFCRDENAYEFCLKIVLRLSVFFAIGVLLQRFMPSVYTVILNAFPAKYAAAIRTGAEEFVNSGLRGFTTNTGTVAGYICSGMIALVALNIGKQKRPVKFYIIIAVFLVALLFTGKRGPSIFLLLSLILSYLLPEHGSKKIRRYWVLFILILFVTLFFSYFGSYFQSVPLIREVITTINGITAGDDVSNLRIRLYWWAFELFKKNPILGIGWGEYRSTVIGNVSRLKTLDVHNIYLQLLCETGIIGFACFMMLFVSFWLSTKKYYCDLKARHPNSVSIWRNLLLFSLTFQSFFLLYGFTGNVLYDQHYQIVYAICCGITLAYRVRIKDGIN